MKGVVGRRAGVGVASMVRDIAAVEDSGPAPRPARAAALAIDCKRRPQREQ